MTPDKDAFGQEILAYFRGKDSYEIIEREDGLIGLSGGAKSYFANYNNWPEKDRLAMELVKGKVLDIGAGAGRIALYLQRKKFSVIAIDNSPLAIKVCKARGVKDARVLPIEKISSFAPDLFDTIIMLGNNFGLFGNYNKAKKILKILHKITGPKASIIAESNDPHKTKDAIHHEYHQLNKKRGRMAGQLRIRVRFKKHIGDWFDYLLVSKAEMKDILKGTGWKIRKFINSDGSTYIAVIGKE